MPRTVASVPGARAGLPCAAFALLLLALLVPVAAAHGAPSPKDQDTRLLADMNDDCGGDGAGQLANCRGTHDLIALDVRETYDAGLGDLVTFRLFLNGGDTSGGLKDTLTLKADGTAKTFTLSTTNNQAFTGTGFDRVGSAQSINDGTRFAVEASVKRDSLGGIGSKLTDFHVEAAKGSTQGDFMPGTYHAALGGNGPPPSSEQSDPQNYVRPEYALRGPTYYVSLQPPARTSLAVGEEVLVQLDLKNELRTTAQVVTLSVSGGDGVQARLHNAATTGYADSLQVDLPKAGTGFAHLALQGQAEGASGTITITITTDQGGRSTGTLPYAVTAAADDGSGDAGGTDGGNGGGDGGGGGGGSKGSPSPATPLVALALAAAALAARRHA